MKILLRLLLVLLATSWIIIFLIDIFIFSWSLHLILWILTGEYYIGVCENNIKDLMSTIEHRLARL